MNTVKPAVIRFDTIFVTDSAIAFKIYLSEITFEDSQIDFFLLNQLIDFSDSSQAIVPIDVII